jgi:hypothetical protein
MLVMAIKDDVILELDRLARQGVSEAAPGALVVDTPNGRLESELVAIETLGCSFQQFVYKTPKLANATVDELKQISNSLSAKLSYLLEPIRPVEIDRGECIVQLRSNPPQKDDDGTSYYELIAKKGGLTLCRFNKPSGQPRRIIPAHVTREVFQRLANDFATIS